MESAFLSRAWLATGSLLLLGVPEYDARAGDVSVPASAVSQAVATVLPFLMVETQQEFGLPDASAGEPAYTISLPRISTESGSFDSSAFGEQSAILISGEADRTVAVIMPTEVEMKRQPASGPSRVAGGGEASSLSPPSAGGEAGTVRVSRFSSNMMNGMGKLDSAGKRQVVMGATRAALVENQFEGQYVATVVVNVVY